MKSVQKSAAVTRDTRALTGLRFIIITLLIVHHLGYPIPTGVLSVSFFVILSGFVIGYSNCKGDVVYDVKGAFHFYEKRILKLYPLYLLVTLIVVLEFIYVYKITFGIEDLLPHLMMIKT